MQGDDGSPAELSRRIETIEERLAEKEEKLLEQELLLEQVSFLAAKATVKSQSFWHRPTKNFQITHAKL